MKWFYHLKLAKKLILSFIVVALIAGIVGLVGIFNMNKLNERNTRMYTHMTVPISQASSMVNMMQRIRVNAREVILQTSAAEKQNTYGTIQQLMADLDKVSLEFEQTIISAEVRTAFNEFQAARQQYSGYVDDLVELAESNRPEEAYRFLNETMRTTAKAQEDALDRMVAQKIADAERTSRDNDETARSGIAVMVAIVAAAVLLATLLGIWIARMISRPVNEIVDAAGKLAEGNLDVELDISTRDEVGALAAAFNHMTGNINDVMMNINASADQVSSGSVQVSETSMMLSQGATEQASTVEELTAALEEISSQTSRNADNADAANKLATDARTRAVQGNNQMQEMLEAMQDINQSSSNISKIIKVIDEIAFQTNILALNAAVEAARAGQHGKGFAVVAEEVRNLAARSANAAKETTDMIEGSVRKVEGGTRIAHETAEALNQIVEVVTEVTELVSQIARASNEQAIGVAQVAEGISQVSQVTQTNSATSEESAAASEELSSQAEVLKELVARFVLKSSRVQRSAAGFQGEAYNPEVMRMLEQMSESQAAAASQNDTRRPASGRKVKISLTDREFGKY